MFVMREHNLTNHVAHADHRILEPALAPSLRSALLTLDGISIDIIAAEAIFGGNEVGSNALRHEVGFVGHRRVHRPGTAVGPHRNPRHALHAATNRKHRLTGHHLGRCHIAGLKPRSAEPVDLHARRRFGIVGIQHRNAGNVRPLLSDRGNATKHHIVDIGGVDPGPVAQRLQHLGCQLDRRDLMQRAVLAALAARGPDRVVDIGFGHRHSPYPSPLEGEGDSATLSWVRGQRALCPLTRLSSLSTLSLKGRGG